MSNDNVGPTFKHDCEVCQYLGHFEDHDLYYCGAHGGMPTVIARWDGSGPEYTSGLIIAKARDFKSMRTTPLAASRALRVAYLIAKDSGLDVSG